MIFDSSLDASGGTLTVKNKAVAKVLELKRNLIVVKFGELEILQ